MWCWCDAPRAGAGRAGNPEGCSATGFGPCSSQDEALARCQKCRGPRGPRDHTNTIATARAVRTGINDMIQRGATLQRRCDAPPSQAGGARACRCRKGCPPCADRRHLRPVRQHGRRPGIPTETVGQLHGGDRRRRRAALRKAWKLANLPSRLSSPLSVGRQQPDVETLAERGTADRQATSPRPGPSRPSGAPRRRRQCRGEAGPSPTPV
jgi:hypothetical protein